jgi:Domain of unknown function (DUF4169)
MTTPTNINKARKARDRAEKQRLAEANRIKHGLSRAEKALEDARRAKAAQTLDGAQLDAKNPQTDG